MIYYFIGEESEDLVLGPFLYRTPEDAQGDLDGYKNRDEFKIFKVEITEFDKTVEGLSKKLLKSSKDLDEVSNPDDDRRNYPE